MKILKIFGLGVSQDSVVASHRYYQIIPVPFTSDNAWRKTEPNGLERGEYTFKSGDKLVHAPLFGGLAVATIDNPLGNVIDGTVFR